jgi:hypothetical protein
LSENWTLDEKELSVTFINNRFAHTWWAPNREKFEERIKTIKEKMKE